MTDIYRKDHTMWHLIDLEEFEYSIRQEMTSAEVDRRRKARQQKTAKHNKKIERTKYFAIQKLMGLFFILGTAVVCMLFRNMDISFAIITIPIGILLIFSREKCLVGKNNRKNKAGG